MERIVLIPYIEGQNLSNSIPEYSRMNLGAELSIQGMW